MLIKNRNPSFSFYRRPCSRDPGQDVESECPDNYFTLEDTPEGCPEIKYCYLGLNQTCNEYLTESRCEVELQCLCNRCLGCDERFNCVEIPMICEIERLSKFGKRISNRPPIRGPIHPPIHAPVHLPLGLPWFLRRWLEKQGQYPHSYTKKS